MTVGEPAKTAVSGLVSVIIPCYNHAHFLGEAIESVLSQTYPRYEIIVVDDGSIDNTLLAASYYPEVRFIRQENQGPSAARNKGLYECKGSHIVFLDADDRLLPNALETGLKCLDAHPECAFVYGHVRLISSDGSPLPTPEQSCVRRDYYPAMLRFNYIWTTGVIMFRRGVLESVGGFNTSMKSAVDWDLNLRVTRVSSVHCHDKAIAEYRLHDQNLTRRSEVMLKYSLTALYSQRRHVRGNGTYEAAYKAGIRTAQEYYGERLIRQIEDHIGALRWKEATAEMLALLRYHRKAFLRSFLPVLYRKVSRISSIRNSSTAFFLPRSRNCSVRSRSCPIYEGCHDGVDSAMIVGWAWDINQPDAPVEVDIYVDRTLLATVKADEFRQDLAEAGKGNGRHAFRYPVPHWLKDGKPHSVSVKFGGSPIDLDLTPKKVHFESERSQGLAADFLRSVLKSARRSVRAPRTGIAKGLILMYHRIAEIHPDPWSLCVSPGHFAEHLEVVKKYGSLLQLDQFARSMQDGRLSRRAFVITFDDGYADNLHQAKPLLERCDIPATLFLTTGHVGSEREFWWDELEKALLHPNVLPERLILDINRRDCRWELGEASHSGKDAPLKRYPLYRSLHRLLLYLPVQEQQQILSELLIWAGIAATKRETHRSLSYDEVLTLGKGGLIEVGAHSVTHSALAKLPAAAQRDEILCSKAYLEDMLGHPVNGFAYPYGSYSDETVSIVREAGFDCACSVSPGIARHNTDRLRLPRVTVGNWDGEEFARRLSGWFRGGGA